MLHTLRAKVKFASTGKVLEFDIDFQTGLSSITGANEAGKSTVLELIRWSLFGSGALRAPATSYEAIQAYLDFSVKGQRYTVQRTKTTCRVDGTSGPVASGTTHANEAIIKLFGYGLEVFDIAHFCGQNQVDALTAMKPTARKAMVDRVIGMEALDAAAATAAAEASELRAEIKGLELALGQPPREPVPPAFTTAQVKAKLADIDLGPLVAARVWLSSHPARPEPQRPHQTVTATADELREQDAAYNTAVARSRELDAALRGVPAPAYTTEQLDHEAGLHAPWNAWLDQQNFVHRNGEPPTKTLDQLDQMETTWGILASVEEARQVVAQLQAGALTCPECGHSWTADKQRLLDAENIIAAWGELEPPELDLRQIDAMRYRAAAWANRSAPFMVDPPEMPTMNMTEYEAQRRAVALKPLFDERKALTFPPDVHQQLRERLEYDDAMARFEDRHEEWCREEGHRAGYEDVVGRLAPLEKEHAEWSALLPACLEYDAQASAYATLKDQYDTTASKLSSKRAELEEAKNAADAIKTLRSKIKGHLTPSLNVAASHLISTMTGGVRNDIVIDENFETILVDGQPVETLSGSAKAVANLAIRLGLGQVLTNKVFSVFMGDEIDASFDDDRVAYTAECMQHLGSVISQIVLVSHRELPTQHHIRITNA